MHPGVPVGINGIAEVGEVAVQPAGGSVSTASMILVVDDDEPVRVMLARLLRTQGYSVMQARDARDAMRILDEQLPDLVVSDIVMPGESGIELRRRIARQWPHVPVILISGYSTDAPAEFAARTALTSFVPKPFRADDLLQVVRTALADTVAEE